MICHSPLAALFLVFLEKGRVTCEAASHKPSARFCLVDGGFPLGPLVAQGSTREAPYFFSSRVMMLPHHGG